MQNQSSMRSLMKSSSNVTDNDDVTDDDEIECAISEAWKLDVINDDVTKDKKARWSRLNSSDVVVTSQVNSGSDVELKVSFKDLITL